MPINHRTLYKDLLIALLLMFATPAAEADPVAAKNSPYRLNLQPMQTPRPEGLSPPENQSYKDPSYSAPQTVDPQIYQLDYKYRSQTKPAKTIKAGLPTIPATADSLATTTESQTVTSQLSTHHTADTTTNDKLVRQPFSKEIMLAAQSASLDPALVHAVIYVESRYQRKAISPKGAIGLMQLMPHTAARYGVKDAGHSPKANLKAGTLYLRDLMQQFDSRLDLVLAAYNAGEGAVIKHSRKIPPYPETRQYVRNVTAKYNEWRNPEPVSLVANNKDLGVNVPPAKPLRTEYLPGTLFAPADKTFSPNY